MLGAVRRESPPDAVQGSKRMAISFLPVGSAPAETASEASNAGVSPNVRVPHLAQTHPKTRYAVCRYASCGLAACRGRPQGYPDTSVTLKTLRDPQLQGGSISA